MRRAMDKNTERIPFLPLSSKRRCKNSSLRIDYTGISIISMKPLSIATYTAAWIISTSVSSCREDKETDDGVGYFEGDPQPVDPDCTGVRTTAYTASSGGWGEFDRTLDILPNEVRRGMTFAVAEPWNGGSYQGEPGEACGECWEVSTVYATQVVMVHDLCPIEGNPLCSGGYFHFDLSSEAGEVLGGGLGHAAARRVPCPVEGNIHFQVNDSNEWGYLRGAFVNHRLPIRAAKIRALPDGDFRPFERSGGAWHIIEGPVPADGEGIEFELTAPNGEIVLSNLPLDIDPLSGTVHDLGVQFSLPEEEGTGECRYIPPGDIFDEDWGGIEGVKWMPNPWGNDASIEVIHKNCKDNSSACLQITLGQWEGAHLFRTQEFPSDTFSTLTLSFWGISGNAELTVAPSMDGERCTKTLVNVVKDKWTDTVIELSRVCKDGSSINGVTFSNNSAGVSFILDEVLFE